MKTYIGTKIVQATPMGKFEAKSKGLLKEGSGIPSSDEPGYKVIYPDGYESWSPKEVFDLAYQEMNQLNFDFGTAIKLLKEGKKVARYGWNGKGMFLIHSKMLVVHQPQLEGIVLHESDSTCCLLNSTPDKEYQMSEFILMKTADDKMVPWLASQTDILAQDWQLVDSIVQ